MNHKKLNPGSVNHEAQTILLQSFKYLMMSFLWHTKSACRSEENIVNVFNITCILISLTVHYFEKHTDTK